jgi:hypothetical protein
VTAPVVLISWLEIERRSVEQFGSPAGSLVPAWVRQVGGSAAVFGGPESGGGVAVVAQAARTSNAAAAPM